MPHPPTKHGPLLLALFESRDAVPIAEIVATFAATVPPGKAIRARNRILVALRARQGREKVTNKSRYNKAITEDDAILMGSRQIARETISHFVERGYLARDPERKMIFIGPRWEHFKARFTKEATNGQG